MLSLFNFGVLLCLAAFGLCMTAPAWRQLWFLHALALVYTLGIVMFFVFARYRFPLVPVLALVAAGGLAAWPVKSARRMRGWAFAAVVVAASVTFVSFENTRADRVANYVNIANLFLADRGKWDDAAVFYDKALKECPDRLRHTSVWGRC